MLDLSRAAAAMGFKACGVRANYSALAHESMPCIAHVVTRVGQPQFLVIYKIHKNHIRVGDPAKGKYLLSRTEFVEIWKQQAVLLLKPEGPLMRLPAPSWLQWLLGYLRRQEAWLGQILFTGLVYAALGLLTTLAVQTLIDTLIPHRDQTGIRSLGIALLILLSLRCMAGYLRDRFLIAANKRLSLTVTNDFVQHLFHLPASFFHTRKTGDITARINDSLGVYRTCVLLLQSVILELLLAVGGLALLCYFSAKLALVILVLMPLYIRALWWRGCHLRQKQMEVMQARSATESTWIDTIHGMDDIISFNASPLFAGRNQTRFGLLQDNLEQLGLLQASLTLITSFFGTVSSVIVLILGALEVSMGRLQLGQFMAAWSLLSFILPSLTSVTIGLVEIQGAAAAAQRLLDLLTEEPEPASISVPHARWNTMEITGLSFAWPKSSQLLENINMAIPTGRITALWGPSGAGKSTLVQLMQRKYLPQSGSIRLDGRSLQDFSLQAVRQSIAVVPQEIKIFNATLAENILMSRKAASLDDVVRTVDKSGVGILLQRFPHGLLTQLGEDGRKLSGGERQLLGLMRAMYDAPQLLVIDEGFSAIDPGIEQLLSAAIARYAQNHAVLLITHNLESLLAADYLYLLRDGTIIQEGPPAELMDREGLFQELFLIKHRINHSRMATIA